MSKQSLLEFGDRVMEDKVLHTRLKSLQPNDAKGLIAIAEEAGYRFTSTELMEVIEETKANMEKSQELTEADLDGVAGGTTNSYLPGLPMKFLAAYFTMSAPGL